MYKEGPASGQNIHLYNSVIFPWQSVLRSLNLREETALVLTSRKVTETPKESQPCSVRETMNGETRYAHVPGQYKHQKLNNKCFIHLTKCVKHDIIFLSFQLICKK